MWSATSITDRNAVVNKIADVIETNIKEIAQLLTKEQGKPLNDAIREVLGTAAFFRYFTLLNLPVKIIDNPDSRKVEGCQGMAGASGLLKRITLELGGNDAGIALDDLSPKEVAPKLSESASQNNRQVCIAMTRLYVHEIIHDEVVEELASLTNDAVMGDGLHQGTTLGP